MKTTIVVLSVIFASLSAIAQGGASTVGDGGHVISCGGRHELFDLFEYRVNTSVNAQLTLAVDKSTPIKEMINTGMNRIQKRFSLTSTEMIRIKRATKMLLLDSQTQDDKGWLRMWSIGAQNLVVSKSVGNWISELNCQVYLAVIRPPLNSYFRSICSHNVSEFEYCFIILPETFRSLEREQKACLAIHEALRFLPENKKLGEAALRFVTAQICTEPRQ